VKGGFEMKAMRRFWSKFQDVTVPHIKTIHTIIHKLLGKK
jgi:hypothetical protein